MLGTRPVPRGINAAAPAAAMPAAETSREVGRLSGGGNPWAWEGVVCSLLVFPFLGGIAVLILPAHLAPQPKAAPLLGPGPLLALSNPGTAAGGDRDSPRAGSQATGFGFWY